MHLKSVMGACKDCAPNHHEMVANYPPHQDPSNKTPPEIPQKTQMSTGSNDLGKL